MGSVGSRPTCKPSAAKRTSACTTTSEQYTAAAEEDAGKPHHGRSTEIFKDEEQGVAFKMTRVKGALDSLAVSNAALGAQTILHILAPPLALWLFLQLLRVGPDAPTMSALVLTILLPIVWPCVMFKCKRRSKRWIRGACSPCSACSLFISVLVTFIVCYVLLLTDPPSVVRPALVPNERVAVIGGGASGTFTAWMLKQDPRATVHLYEAEAVIGGHSATEMVDGKHLDMGFIFSKHSYNIYNSLTDRFGFERQVASLSVAYGGDEKYLPYSNEDGGAGKVFREAAKAAGDPARADRLEAELARFLDMSRSATLDIGSAITPLWYFLWRHGFSKDFTHSVLIPILTVLFVTGHGALEQSAGLTLQYFKPGGPQAFLTLNASSPDSPPVYHTLGGVKYLYDQLLADVDMLVGRDVFLSSPTRRLVRVGAQWRVDVVGGGDGQLYDKVVLAVDAKMAKVILEAGGMGGLMPMVLGMVDYDDLSVSLNRVDPDGEIRSGALYRVDEGGCLAGSIDRVLDNGDGDFRLQGIPPTAQERVVSSLDLGEAVASRSWRHTRWTVWELIVTKRLVTRLNYRKGVILAGAWVEGVGQNDALRSGALAACAVGISDATATMFRQMVAPYENWTDFCTSHVAGARTENV